jgi:hypothetical protein
LAPIVENRGDWILLSGRDPSNLSSTSSMRYEDPRSNLSSGTAAAVSRKKSMHRLKADWVRELLKSQGKSTLIPACQRYGIASSSVTKKSEAKRGWRSSHRVEERPNLIHALQGNKKYITKREDLPARTRPWTYLQDFVIR